MPSDRSIAYFSMEIGLRTEMPTYSGGLGVLAGDTLRAAADLGVPVVAVTLALPPGLLPPAHRGGWHADGIGAGVGAAALPDAPEGTRDL